MVFRADLPPCYFGGMESFAAFTDELQKLASVRKPVKEYRRALQGFADARQSAKTMGPPAWVSSSGFAHHGTPSLPEILESGRLIASPLGETGQHGPGVYWWKGFPREGFLEGPQDEGLLSDLKTLPDKRPPVRNYKSGHINPHMQRTGPGDYKLRPKDTAVIDMATRSENKTLSSLLADAAEQRARTMDTSMFHRARKQVISGGALTSPTKQELLRTYARRLRGFLA